MSVPPPDLRPVKKRAYAEFAKLPGVHGCGIGAQGLRVYVQDEAAAARIPGEFEGVPVECIITGELRAL